MIFQGLRLLLQYEVYIRTNLIFWVSADSESLHTMRKCTFCVYQGDVKQWHWVQDGRYCEALLYVSIESHWDLFCSIYSESTANNDYSLLCRCSFIAE